MKLFGIVAIALIVIVLGLAFVKRSRRKKKFCQRSGLKHPTGYIKYHKYTETRVKSALAEGKESDSKSVAKKPDSKQAVALITFKGDIRASERHSLSRLIDEVVLNKERFNEVVIRVESPGGSVTDYGHVYSEVKRLRDAGLKLTACVDTIAASGGYLMCLPAERIVAAPFAMVGSIGVVSFVPNVRRLLEKFLIEPRTFTAGDFKRTVTFTDNATPEQVQLYKQQLQLIHDQFKEALKTHRPFVELSKVATGEAWLASTSVGLDLKLVDEVRVSSDLLLELNRHFDIVEFRESTPKKSLFKRLREGAQLVKSLLSLDESSGPVSVLQS